MLNLNQVKIFLANRKDFILTRGMFYSPKTYPGLEEFANNLRETIIGKLLFPKETFDKFRYEFKDDFLTDAQKEFLWEQAGVIRRPPIYYKIMGLGHYSAYHSTSKTYLFQECETSEDWRNYLKNFERRLGRLHDEFEEYFRRRRERGKKLELLVWNSIECCLYDARRVGNFDLEYQRFEPVIKAWEQRNNASFYGNWNWEDLLGKEISYEETLPKSPTSTNPNQNNNSSNQASSLENRESNSPNRYISLHRLKPQTSPSNNSSSTNSDISSSPETNKAIYQGGLWGVALLFLLVVVILISFKKYKKK